MPRRTLYRLLTWLGLTLAAMLLIGGGLLRWGHHFVANEVHTQLGAQQIYFSAKGSAATAGPDFAPMPPGRDRKRWGECSRAGRA